MGYEKTNWKTGDVIAAEKLNKLEDGVASGGSGGGSDVMVVKMVRPDPYTTKIDKETSDVLNAIADGKPIIFADYFYDAVGCPHNTSTSTFSMFAYQVSGKTITCYELSVDSDGIVTATALGTVALA